MAVPTAPTPTLLRSATLAILTREVLGLTAAVEMTG
jgi:hypothetical protein